MRGTLLAHGVECAITGIIPAYAGNTFIPRSINIFSQDHPRICGEHIAKNLTTGEVKGSSPHMRGTRIRPPEYARTLGIIPAYAGNTPPCPGRAAIHWDHPRICGEHVQTADCEGVQAGSSPHMRGTLSQCGGAQHVHGIIPAYAGNTMTRDSCPPIWLGSSPHMRGTLSLVHAAEQFDGIIPAYAGNTV